MRNFPSRDDSDDLTGPDLAALNDEDLLSLIEDDEDEDEDDVDWGDEEEDYPDEDFDDLAGPPPSIQQRTHEQYDGRDAEDIWD